MADVLKKGTVLSTTQLSKPLVLFLSGDEPAVV
jgi:hypothetical protein